MQRAGNILKQFVNNYGLEGALRLQAIKDHWITLVGETIASHTFPDTVKGKTIFITVDTPQWMHHLSFYKQEIAEKLKPYKIEEVRFKLGRLPENPDMAVKSAAVRQLTDEDSRYIEDTVKNLKDDELREKFKKLIGDAMRGKRDKVK